MVDRKSLGQEITFNEAQIAGQNFLRLILQSIIGNGKSGQEKSNAKSEGKQTQKEKSLIIEAEATHQKVKYGQLL
jgi:hypothetical protein